MQNPTLFGPVLKTHFRSISSLDFFTRYAPIHLLYCVKRAKQNFKIPRFYGIFRKPCATGNDVRKIHSVFRKNVPLTTTIVSRVLNILTCDLFQKFSSNQSYIGAKGKKLWWPTSYSFLKMYTKIFFNFFLKKRLIKFKKCVNDI